MKFIKNLSLTLILAPLLTAPMLASNSNARAPQSLGIGERPPSPSATEGKEQEPKAPVIYHDYSADLDEEIRIWAEQIATTDDMRQDFHRQLKEQNGSLIENYRQSIGNAQDTAIDARDQKGKFALFKHEQELIYARMQLLRIDRQYRQLLHDARENNEEIEEQARERIQIKLLSGQEYPANVLQEILEPPTGGIVKQGFTQLMYAAARNNQDNVASLLAKGADCTLTTNLISWMTDEQTSTNLRAIFARLNRDNTFSKNDRGYKIETELPEEIALPKAINLINTRKLCILSTHIDQRIPIARLDALSLSVIAGNPEIVDLLLQAMAQKLEASKLLNTVSVRWHLNNAIHHLLIYADLAELEEAKPLFAALGISEPNKEQYVAIAKKIMRFCAAHSLLDGGGAEFLFATMSYGPTHLTQALAEEGFPATLNLNFQKPAVLKLWKEKLVEHNLGGEKLGILFSINAPEGSWVAGLRTAMLPMAFKHWTNPTFLLRLQEYVRDHQMLPTAMRELNTHLIPDLASLIRSYITRPQHQAVPAEVATQILAISYEDACLAHQAKLLVRNKQEQIALQLHRLCKSQENEEKKNTE